MNIKILLDRIEKSFILTQELIEHTSEEDLDKDLPNIPSNTLRNQLWCVIGARESYLKAIKEKKVK